MPTSAPSCPGRGDAASGWTAAPAPLDVPSKKLLARLRLEPVAPSQPNQIAEYRVLLEFDNLGMSLRLSDVRFPDITITDDKGAALPEFSWLSAGYMSGGGFSAHLPAESCLALHVNTLRIFDPPGKPRILILDEPWSGRNLSPGQSAVLNATLEIKAHTNLEVGEAPYRGTNLQLPLQPAAVPK